MKIKGVLSNQFYYEFGEPTEGRPNTIIAWATTPEGKKHRIAGSMSWEQPEVGNEDLYAPGEGEITGIHVYPQYQRRGIATKMFHLARQMAHATNPELGNELHEKAQKSYNFSPSYRFLRPEHSTTLTEEGADWALSTKTKMPPVDRWLDDDDNTYNLSKE